MTIFRLILLGLAMVSTLRAESAGALRAGESYTYHVSWGPFFGAGEITLSATNDLTEGLERLHITTRTSTRGVIRLIFPFDGTGDSFFDEHDGRLLEMHATTKARSDKTDATILFDYKKAEAVYTDYIKPKRSTTLAVPEGHFSDFITALIQARYWNLTPGESREVQVLFDDEFYHLKITAERIEKISTAGGKKSALLLIPRMVGKPKGMFRKGGEVRVWIADDAEHLPLRFEVKLQVGTAVALLTAHTEPVNPQLAMAGP
ncbi:MAG TPA: DUF3108 domain-containing protein [Rariglobus sp.]|jgi:hypothetical protein|nr:DUF3108 domain-containing protein [Rariglobus sp.]